MGCCDGRQKYDNDAEEIAPPNYNISVRMSFASFLELFKQED